jgi:hypothetical protein
MAAGCVALFIAPDTDPPGNGARYGKHCIPAATCCGAPTHCIEGWNGRPDVDWSHIINEVDERQRNDPGTHGK